MDMDVLKTGQDHLAVKIHDPGFVGAYDVNEVGLKSLQEELVRERRLTRRLDVTDKADYDATVAEFGEVTGGHLSAEQERVLSDSTRPARPAACPTHRRVELETSGARDPIGGRASTGVQYTARSRIRS